MSRGQTGVYNSFTHRYCQERKAKELGIPIRGESPPQRTSMLADRDRVFAFLQPNETPLRAHFVIYRTELENGTRPACFNTNGALPVAHQLG
jgi:hypothetical protein